MIVCICEFWRKNVLSSGYLRGIFGGRGSAEESCYKGTKKIAHLQVFYLLNVRLFFN